MLYDTQTTGNRASHGARAGLSFEGHPDQQRPIYSADLQIAVEALPVRVAR